MPKHLFRVKKFKPEDIVEENDYYLVVYGDNSQFKLDNKYIVICKKDKGDESYFPTNEYKIINKTLIHKTNVGNDYDYITYGIENVRARIFEIDSYTTALVDGKEQTLIRYTEEIYPRMEDVCKKYNMVRIVSAEDGQLFKKPKGAKIEIINENVSNNTNCV